MTQCNQLKYQATLSHKYVQYSIAKCGKDTGNYGTCGSYGTDMKIIRYATKNVFIRVKKQIRNILDMVFQREERHG